MLCSARKHSQTGTLTGIFGVLCTCVAGEAEPRCLVKKVCKSFYLKGEQALPAGLMPGRLGATWPHILSYPAQREDM